MALLPANPGEALWIGGSPGQNHFNVGIGQGTSGGDNHDDFGQDVIEDGYSDPDKFFLNSDGNTVFRINAGAGKTSSNTAHPRSELRELLLNGTSRAEWNGSSGSHYMKGRSRLIDVTSNKPWVCFFQIHDAESDLARVQTEGTNGTSTGLSIVCRRTPPGGEEIRTVLRTGYDVNDWVSWEIRIDSGRLRIMLDGVTVLDVTGMGTTGCYFKMGCYLQDNVEKGASASDWAAVEVERGSFVTWHTGTPSPTTPVFTGGSDPGGGPGGGDGTPDVAPPTVPTGTVAVRGDRQLALSWTPSTDNVGVTGYNVWRFSSTGAPSGGSEDPLTAAGRYGWGAPLASSDEFGYSGVPNASKWSVYDGPGHDGNGVRDDARVTVDGSKMILTGLAGSANTGGLAHDLDQQYGRWEVRCRSFYTSTPPPAGGFTAHVFVSPSGSDSNNGTSAATPKKTLAAALTLATAGQTISMANGTYTGNFVSSKAGTAGNFITIRAANKWGATIVGNSATAAESVVQFDHQYLRLRDVVVTGPGGEGSGARNGVELNADNTEVIGCHIHTICQWLTGGTGWQGGAGISVNGPNRSNVLADGNVIHDIGLRSSTQQLVHGAYCTAHATNGRFVNNVIYECEDFGLHPYDDTENSGWQFVNNTVAYCGRGILQTPNGITRNNIVHNVSGRHYDIRGTGNVGSNNRYSGSGTGPTGGSVGATSISSPGFVNAAAYDFHLTAGSVLVNAGTSTDAPSTDADGVTRATVDIGAYEYAAATTGDGGYHPVLIVWPTSDDWPDDGEYDFLENGEPGEQSAGAFMHYPSTNSADQIDVPNFPVDLTQFHNFAFEWTSEHVKGWVDGDPWFSYSGGAGGARQNIQDMPSGHLTVQLDAFQASGLLASTMELEWARVYDLTATGAGGGSGATVVLGKDAGGAGETSSSADKIVASRFTAPAAGTLAAGHARLWLSASGSTSSKMMVYANSGSAPGALLATSDQITVTSTTESVRDYVFSGAARIAITAGTDYWVAVAWDDPGTPSVTFSRDGDTGGRVESTATYGTPPDPFGTVSGTFTGPADVWCEVVTGGDGDGGGGTTTASFGKLTDGGSNSASSADKIAVSRFTADTSGTLTAGHARAWLSSSGSVGTRMVVYADSAGEPGALLATSDETTVTATSEGLRDYTFSGGAQISIANGTDYWIGVAWDDPGTPSLTLSRDGTTALRRETVTYTYPTMPNPFGTTSSLTGPIDVYVDVSASTGGGGWVLVGSPTGPSFVNVGLTNGAVYSYAVSAKDAAGNESARSNTFEGVPGDPDSLPPSVPENLVATPGSGRVTLTWSAATDIDSGIGQYHIYIGGSRAATVQAGDGLATAIVLIGLTNGTSYSFTISAVDRAGNESAQSAAVNATPTAAASGGAVLLPGRLPSGAKVEVSIAFGANLSADEDSWAWVDVTDDVRFDPGISTALGRNDESSTSNPASLTLVLDNASGDYSLGGKSARWPYIRRGTPVRVRIDPADGVGARVVLLAFADGWTPGWDTLRGNIPVVTLSASGTLRRLAQGDAPVTSAYRRVMSALASNVAYWPMEEGKDATYAPDHHGGSDFTVTGSPDWGSNDDFACSAALPTLRNGRLVADVAPYTDTGKSQLRWLMSIPAGGLPDGTVLAHISMTGGLHRWDLTYGRDAAGVETLGLYRYNAPADPGTFHSSTPNIAFTTDGVPCRFGLAWVQNGSNIDWQVSVTPAVFGANAFFLNGTITGKTAGIISHIDFNPHSASLDFAVGHITIENQITSLFADSDALVAHAGEYPTSANGRLYRLCQENRVPVFRYSTGATLSLLDRMGPQTVAPLLQLLRECETTDQGMLWDGRAAGLQYTSRRRKDCGTVRLTVDASTGQLAAPFDPTDDDQRTRNRMTVTRYRGVTITREDTTGPLGTDIVGIYDDAATINTLADSMARQYAKWFVAAGTVEGYRYPSVTVDLAASPTLAGAVLDIIPGDRIEVTGLDTTLAGFPVDTVSLIVEGIAHDITPRQWSATFRCSLFLPWAVGEVAAASGDTSDMVMRLDTDGSALASSASAGAASLSVASSGALWTTAADDYPLHLSVGGVRVRVTACTGASSPQTFTLGEVATLSRTGWTVTADSEELVDETAPASNVLDGNTGTMWHTTYGAGGTAPQPHTLTVDMGSSTTVSGLKYLPRSGGGNGTILQYEVHTSTNGSTWGSAVASGTWANDATEKTASFSGVTARYVRLTSITATGGDISSAAEINLVGPTGEDSSLPVARTSGMPVRLWEPRRIGLG